MNRHVTRVLGAIAIALALPIGLHAADLSSQPIGAISFAPKLIVDIKAKSMVGPSIQLDERRHEWTDGSLCSYNVPIE
jgi:hypothetical protein